MSNESKKNPFYKKTWFWGSILLLAIMCSFVYLQQTKSNNQINESVIVDKDGNVVEPIEVFPNDK